MIHEARRPSPCMILFQRRKQEQGTVGIRGYIVDKRRPERAAYAGRLSAGVCIPLENLGLVEPDFL